MFYSVLLTVALLSGAPVTGLETAAPSVLPLVVAARLTPPPAAVHAAFTKRFPAAQAVKWELEGKEWEAEFRDGKAELSAVFGADGTFREVEREVALTALPAPVLPYLKAQYPGKKIKEATRIEDAAGTVTWEAEVGDNDVIFDAAGTFLHVEADHDHADKTTP